MIGNATPSPRSSRCPARSSSSSHVRSRSGYSPGGATCSASSPSSAVSSLTSRGPTSLDPRACTNTSRGSISGPRGEENAAASESYRELLEVATATRRLPRRARHDHRRPGPPRSPPGRVRHRGRPPEPSPRLVDRSAAPRTADGRTGQRRSARRPWDPTRAAPSHRPRRRHQHRVVGVDSSNASRSSRRAPPGRSRSTPTGDTSEPTAPFHRTWWIGTWPRLAQPPSWMEPFLAGGTITRTMTVVLVPVSTHQSRRRIERDLVKLESDASTKEEKGRRVDARHRRATQALLDREEELVAGYPEMAYAGLVTVSARDLDELEEHGEIIEQLARETGMDLRLLDARQDVALGRCAPARSRTPDLAGVMRPSLRLPFHRGTTAHVSSVYPFSVQASFGHEGTYVGLDLLAGGAEFCWDPFAAYANGLVTNPNGWVLGEPGNGKSALVKCLLWRQAAVYGHGPNGRWIAIADPKGEYAPLAEHLGLTTVRLSPGGTTRINPLAPGPGRGPRTRGQAGAASCRDVRRARRHRPRTAAQPTRGRRDLRGDRTPHPLATRRTHAGRRRPTRRRANRRDGRTTASLRRRCQRRCHAGRVRARQAPLPIAARHVRRSEHRAACAGTDPASCSTCPPSRSTPKLCRS